MGKTEIRARFLEERHRWGETVIASCREENGTLLAIKTKAEEDELLSGITYSFYGSWKNHHRWGKQFEALSFIEVQPHDQKGIIAYLRQAPGIGSAMAMRLWSLYKGDAVQILREQPESIAAQPTLKGLNEERAKKAAKFLEEKRDIEDATIALMNLMAGKGFPRKALKMAIKKWGNRAASVVKKNPYNLMTIPGCGFTRTDTMYLEMGKNPARLKRQALCLWYFIHSNSDGHTWFHPHTMESFLKDKIGSAAVRAVLAAKLGIRSGLLAVHRDNGTPWLTESSRSKVEQRVADRVAVMMAMKPKWPLVESLEISKHQREQLKLALAGRIAIFGGSPGTGKTYSAAKLIKDLCAIHGRSKVAVVAPTGKAAVRISEALNEHGIDKRAKTIHSYLGVVSAEEGGQWIFEHGIDNPVEEHFIVADESSMIDTSLMASLLDALPLDAHLLLVGDIQQLPPVGHGAPLRDLIAAGVPSGDLREIQRNSGEIVRVCANIRDQEPFDLPAKVNLSNGKNISLHHTVDGDQSADAIFKKVKAIRDYALADPVWQTQVIVAVNEKSAVSRSEMNRILQAEFNSQNKSDSKFWTGDKVVCLKNSFWPAVDVDGGLEDDDVTDVVTREREGNQEIYVANGELGRVLEEFPNRTIMEFFSPRRVVLVPRGENQKPPFDLGYAISCHKSQGSEWPVIIIAIDDYYGAKMVCDRSWLYTAISRAKKACFLVGQEKIIKEMVYRQKINQRKTFLVDRLATARQQYEQRSGEDQHEENISQGSAGGCTVSNPC